MLKKSVLAMAAASVASAAAIAGKAHVHGLSQLSVVSDGTLLQVEWISPAMDLVGFEYAAQSAEEKEIVERAEASLRDHQSIVSIACTHVSTTLDMGDLEGAHAHDDEHNHLHEDEHVHDDHEEFHTDVTVVYEYRCDQGVPKEMGINAFDVFADVQTFNVEYALPQSQGVAQVTAEQRVVTLQP